MKHRDTERAAEMELAIALWQESALTKYSFCKQEALCRSTFDYWLVKYAKMPKKDKSSPVKKQDKSFVAFLKTLTDEPLVTDVKYSDPFR